MEYRISKQNDSILVKVLGPFSKNAINMAGVFLKPILINVSRKIILDISELKEAREMIFHFGLINAFKKEIEQAGGELFVKTNETVMQKYLHNTGLYRLFKAADGKLI